MSAAALKEAGNNHFKAGAFKDAIDCYTQALSATDDKHEKVVYYKNRAACHLKQVSSTNIYIDILFIHLYHLTNILNNFQTMFMI